MAYFRCTGGGSGATLTLTFSSEFYGQTITATNGTKTVTKVAPSTGTMEITLPESGTWVISSTVSGSTYTTTVEVDIDYTATLEAIPDGSTVLPTDDIQTWLKCAGIRDKTTYTTLADVLNDVDTFIALCADSNASDYMARSTTWALAEGSVPVMTDNTHPSGVCSGTSIGAATTDFYKAFDGDNTTNWFSASGQVTNQRLFYTFPSAVKIKRFKTINSCTNQSYTTNLWKNFKIQGSNDGFVNDIHDLYTGVQPQTLQYEQEGILNNDDSYTSYGILCIDNYGSSSQIGYLGTLQFYTDADITTNPTAMQIVGKYDYCANALLSNSTWASAIIASSYADYVMTYERGLVPVMTSNTTPSGQCFGSGNYNSDFYYAFNNQTAMPLGWASQDNSYEKYVGYKFPQSTLISAIKLWTPPNANNNEVKTFKVQYKNSQNAWIDVTGVLTYLTATQSSAFSKAYIFDTPVQTEEIRILVLSNIASNNIIRVCLAQFYSLEYPTSSQLATIHGAANDSIYYLDNGSPVTIATTDSSGVGTVDLSSLSGTLTLYSTVAKNPTDLSADYSKDVRVNENVTEVYVMPIRSLYWKGYQNGIESVTSANGWSRSGYTLVSPTYNTRDVGISSASATQCAFATKNVIQIDAGTKLCMIAKGTTNISGVYTRAGLVSNKSMSSWWAGGKVELISTSTTFISLTYNSANSGYLIAVGDGGMVSNIDALWLE